MGNEGWGWDDVLPLFRRAENQERGEDDYHGVGGPLNVSNMRLKRPICDAWVAAAQNEGYPFNTDYNGASQEGVGYFQLTARNGRRCSAAVAYLNPVKRRPNLTIVTNAHVQKILFDGTRATGLIYRDRGGREHSHFRTQRNRLVVGSHRFTAPSDALRTGRRRRIEAARN